MKAKNARAFALATAIAGGLVVVGACSTSEISPQSQLPAVPPPYVKVPHPAGYALGDLRAIFTTPDAPKLVDLKDCDADYKKLRTVTESSDELAQGARELVKLDPVKYHWCFYGKILRLEDELKADDYLDERQKSVLEAYATLAPLARAFLQEYHDSRYLRWAVRYYRQISEYVFYRKLELTPQATSDLVEAAAPMGLLREPAESLPVLEKYSLVKPGESALVPTAPTPASSPAPLAAVTGATGPAATTAALAPPPANDPMLPPPLSAVETAPALAAPTGAASLNATADPAAVGMAAATGAIPPTAVSSSAGNVTDGIQSAANTAPGAQVAAPPLSAPVDSRVATPDRLPAGGPLPPSQDILKNLPPPVQSDKLPEKPAAKADSSSPEGTSEALLQGDAVIPAQ